MVSNSPVLLEKHLGNSFVAVAYPELIYADNIKRSTENRSCAPRRASGFGIFGLWEFLVFHGDRLLFIPHDAIF